MKNSNSMFWAVFATLLTLQTTKADVLAGWTFETSGLGSPTPSFAPGANTASTNFYAELGLQAGTATAIGLHSTAATYTSPAGNGSAKSFNANNWSLGDYFQFSLSTVGFQNITISYDQNGSATGPRTFYLAYSTDGSSFTKVGTDYNLTAGITWVSGTPNRGTQLSFDLSGITTRNAADTVYFRVLDDSLTTGGAIGGGDVGTSGAIRLDNFVVNGIAIAVPEPSTLALAAIGGLAGLFLLRKRN